MKTVIYTFLILFTLSACTPDSKPGDEFDALQEKFDEEAKKSNVTDDVTIGGIKRSVSYERSALDEVGNVLGERTIYFEFDSSEIASDYEEVLKHHGRYLALNASVNMRIEGHTDERGTREYNVALADRRAQSVKRLLMYQGASSNQILVVSYGEEKPAEFGHDEEAWQLNRRAELVYGE